VKLLALVLGLILERLTTRALRLRELRLFDGYYDRVLGLAGNRRAWLTYPIIIGALAVLTLPVWAVSNLLERPEILWDLAYLSFAVLVVFLCLGPRDLTTEVDDYCSAMDAGDAGLAARLLLEMSESEHPSRSEIDVVEDAIFIQATNRIFGVVFWFIVLGPVGAWIFRVSDLLRRRAVFESIRDGDGPRRALTAIEAIYGMLKWIPARLAMLGYLLSGSFDDGWLAWRNHAAAEGVPIDRRNDEIVAAVGKAAMTGVLDQPRNSSAAARNSMRLVRRTLFIWGTVIALLTIFGWSL
jgi:membrane protein required for beta-lactamase induction